jgi:hypothetical protein
MGVHQIEVTPEMILADRLYAPLWLNWTALATGLIECERRMIARAVVARVLLGSSPQLDWQS